VGLKEVRFESYFPENCYTVTRHGKEILRLVIQRGHYTLYARNEVISVGKEVAIADAIGKYFKNGKKSFPIDLCWH